MADNEIRNPSKAYFKWKMPVITKSEDDWNFWNTEDKYNRTMFIGYNDTTTPHVASLFIIVDGKPMQAVGDDVIARIVGLETNTAQALADIQALIDRVNAQQLEISNLQRECQRILEDAESAVRAAQIWAEGTDAQVAEKGGEHSAKGWAQKANDIVASGLPSDVTFDHLTVTSSSKFGQDPDRANQPGLEIESTGEIQAYRTVNMMNGATVSYDETVEMPWSDSSNKVPNTAWVQQAVMHGTIDPNTELTIKALTLTNGILKQDHTKTQDDGTYKNPKVHFESDAEKFWVKCEAMPDYPRSIELLMMPMYSDARQENFTVTAKESTTTGKINLSATSFSISVGDGTCGIGGSTAHGKKDVTITAKQGNLFIPSVAVSENSRKLAYAATTKYVHDAIKADSVEITADLQPKLTAGAGIEISADNVISATGSSGAVTSVNGKTGEVVLVASDVGAASSSDLASYVTTDAMNTELTNFATTASVDTKLADYQRKLIAGDGIAISESNVISVTGGTGGGAVSSVNGKTGEVVLNATDVGAITGAEADTKITTALEPYAKTADVTAYITAAVAPLATTESLTTGLASKQDKLTAESDLSVNNLTANSLTSATGLTSETGTVSAKKIQTVADTTYNADGSFTRVCLRDIVTKSGTYGYVTLSGDEIRVNGKNTGKALTYLSATGIYDTTAKPAADTSNTRVGTTAWVQSAINAKTANLQPKLTAGTGIAISAENVISATVSSPVDSVNGKTGAVVLNGQDIKVDDTEGAATVKAAIAAKQDAITAGTDLNVRSVKAHSTVIQGETTTQYTMDVTGNGFEMLDATNSISWARLTPTELNVPSLVANGAPGVDTLLTCNGPAKIDALSSNNNKYATGKFSWDINTTTDYNKFEVYNSYYTTDAETGSDVANRSVLFSIGGSPTDNSTWVDFTANYLSFKGNTNFGETGMNHAMNFNGPSTFNNEANFNGSTHVFGNVTYWKTDAEGGMLPLASYDKSTGAFNIDYLTSTDGGNGENRVTIMADSREANYGAVFNLPVTVSDASFKRTSTLAADDNSTEVPTTAWVKSAIAASGGGVPDDISCKTLKVTNWDGELDSIEFAGNLKYSGDYGNGSLGKITAREFYANSSGYYSSRVGTSGITLTSGSGGTTWLNADSSTKKLTITGDTTVTGTSTVHLLNVGDGKEGQKFNCDANASFGYDVNIGWTSGRLKCMRDEYNWLFDFNRNASPGSMLKFNDTVTILSAMPAATDSSNKVPTTAWVQGAITAKAATKPTLTYAEKAGEPTVTKIEQCNGGSLCTIMWTGNVSTATGHVYIDLPAEFASAKIVSTQFTAHDTATAAPWTADASISGGKIMLSVKSTAASSSASATIVLYKA